MCAAFVLTITAAVTLAPLAAVGQTAATTGEPPTPQLAAVSPGPHGYFEYQASPGQTVGGSVRVVNPGPGPATFDVYPVDGMTSPATGVVYSARGQKLAAAGSWMKVSPGTVTLAPGASQVVHFSVTVPPSPFPGNHVAGVAAENPAGAASQQGSAGGAGVALKVNTRVVVAVVVTVPGLSGVAMALGRPAIGEQNGTSQFLSIPMDDTGELLFKPRLMAAVTSCTGAQEATIDRQLDTFVPRTSIDYRWSLAPKVLPSGCYRVRASVLNGTTTLSTVSDQVQVSRHVAAVNPHGQGPDHSLVFGANKSRKGSLLLGLVGGLDVALLMVVLAAILFFFWVRRRDREEEREPVRS